MSEPPPPPLRLVVSPSLPEAEPDPLSLDERAARGFSLYREGRAHRDSGDETEALSCFERAADFVREYPDQQHYANLLMEIARARQSAGNRLGAMAALTEAVRVQGEVGNTRFRAEALAGLGFLHYSADEFVVATARFREALDALELLDEPRERAYLRYYLARSLWLNWKTEDAGLVLDRALRELAATDLRELHLSALRLRGRLHHELHEHREASLLFRSLAPRLWTAGQRKAALACFAKSIGDRMLVHMHRTPFFKPKDMTTRPPEP